MTSPCTRDEALAYIHQCLAQADLSSQGKSSSSATWRLLAEQWKFIYEMTPEKAELRGNPDYAVTLAA